MSDEPKKTFSEQFKEAFGSGLKTGEAIGRNSRSIDLWCEVAGTLAGRGANVEVAIKTADDVREAFVKRFGMNPGPMPTFTKP